MAEPVRLIVWDLDGTFWQGMLAEGGIKAIHRNHDLLIELCRRGIMSSICAQDEFASAQRLLRTLGLWDFFVFPSIEWAPKGYRIAQLIERMAVPAAAVLFIDDNPAHLAEAKALVPDLQVAGPDLVPFILTDARFAGEPDPQMARLVRYKLMERQGGFTPEAEPRDNEDFLRTLGIVVTIEPDIAANIDRAVELIKLSGRLNFTKRQLPADPEMARRQILDAVDGPDARAGLVCVSDSYGHYGICGFYLIRGPAAQPELEHFCFSARIAGMGVEHWLYDWLGRPRIDDGVPAGLAIHRTTDWINAGNMASSLGTAIPEIVLRGGSDLDAIARHCRLNSSNVRAETSRFEWHVFLRQDTSTNLMLTLRKHSPEVSEELQRIGFRDQDLTSRLWTLDPGSIGIFCCWGDIDAQPYRNHRLDIKMAFEISQLSDDLTKVSEENISHFAGLKGLIPETANHVRLYADYISKNYVRLPAGLNQENLRANLHAIFSAVSMAARLFVLLPPSRWPAGDPRAFQERPEIRAYNQLVGAIARAYSHIEIIDVGEFVSNIDDCGAAFGQFDPRIPFRIYQAILERYAQAAA